MKLHKQSPRTFFALMLCLILLLSRVTVIVSAVDTRPESADSSAETRSESVYSEEGARSGSAASPDNGGPATASVDAGAEEPGDGDVDSQTGSDTESRKNADVFDASEADDDQTAPDDAADTGLCDEQVQKQAAETAAAQAGHNSTGGTMSDASEDNVESTRETGTEESSPVQDTDPGRAEEGSQKSQADHSREGSTAGAGDASSKDSAQDPSQAGGTADDSDIPSDEADAEATAGEAGTGAGSEASAGEAGTQSAANEASADVAAGKAGTGAGTETADTAADEAGSEAAAGEEAADAAAGEAAADAAGQAETIGAEISPENVSGTLGRYATVDFHYKKKSFSMEAGTSLPLSTLLSGLEIELALSDIEDVRFSNEDYLTIEKIEGAKSNESAETAGDWLLVSKSSFVSEETLSLLLKDGGTIEIRVTDPEYITHLEELLVDMRLIINDEVIAMEDAAGQTVDVRDDAMYDLIISFQETDEKQFSDNLPLTFTLPIAFKLPNDFSLSLDMSLGRYGKLYDNPVTYDAAANTISVEWNHDDVAQFNRLTSSKDARFTLSLHGTFDISQGRFLFDEDKWIGLQRENLRNAFVSKEGEYNPSTNTITYTVTVGSDGTTEDITLRDVMGAALVYNGDCAYVAGDSVNTAGTTPVIENKGTTFGITIPNMNHNDSLVFTYTCGIDISHIAQSGNATFEETGNTVTIAGDHDPVDNTDAYWENGISFSDLEKENTGVGSRYYEGSTPYRNIGWEIITNRNAVISFAGSTLTDTIDPDVQSICAYTGDGITVKCYDGSDILVSTREVPWEDLGIDDLSTAVSWTYHIPDDDPAYKYVVDYQTRVNMSQIYEQTTIKNLVTGKGGEDAAYAVVSPPGGSGGIYVAKTHTNLTSDHITWVITVTVNKGYEAEAFTLTEHTGTSGSRWANDALPYVWINGTLYKEQLEKVEISGLYEGESFELTYGNKNTPSKVQSNGQTYIDSGFTGANRWTSDYMKIDFFRDDEKDEDGNYVNGGINAPADDDDSRSLIVKITTTFDENWPQVAKQYNDATSQDNNYYYEHLNWVDVNNVYNVDKVSPRPIGIYKRVLTDGTNTARNKIIDDLVYPVYYYQILISGVETDDPLVIEDTFDTELFELYRVHSGRVLSENGSMDYDNWYKTDFGAQTDYNWFSTARGQVIRVGASDTVIQEETETGLRFTFNEIPKTASGGYYKYYGVQYYLTPKNAESLAKMDTLAFQEDSLTTSFSNTASCRGDTAVAQVRHAVKNDLVPLSKTADLDTFKEDNIIQYVIELNKGRLTLNDGLPYVVEDHYSSNQAVDFMSVEIETLPAANRGLISYDFQNYTGTFTVPDNTYIRISYLAQVIDTSQPVQTVSNTVTALNYTKSISEPFSITAKTSGTADIPGLYLFKFGSGHMETGLNGAQFQLYKYDPDSTSPLKEEDGYVPMFYPQNAANGLGGQAIIFTTETYKGRDGYTDVTLTEATDGMILDYDTRYGLKEIVSPTSTASNGEVITYKNLDTKYSFVIKQKDEDPNYANYEFMLGDVMTVRNIPESIGLRIHKVIDGNVADDLTEEDLGNLRFSILRKNSGGGYELMLTELEDGTGSLVSVVNPNFYNIPYTSFVDGYYELSGIRLESGVEAGEYILIETGNEEKMKEVVERYTQGTVSYTSAAAEETRTIAAAHPSWDFATAFRWADSNNTTGVFTITSEDVESGADKDVFITNTYSRETVSLTAEKVWQNTRGAAMAWPGTTNVTLDLYTVSGGALSASPVQSLVLDGVADKTGEETGGTAYFRDLPKTDDAGDPITYAVRERTEMTGYTTAYDGETDADYAVYSTVYPQKRSAVISNRRQATSVTVEKRWQQSADNFEAPAGASAELVLYSHVVGTPESTAVRVDDVNSQVVSAESGWTATFEYLPVVDDNGNRLEYLVKEQSCVPSGYEADYQTAGSSYAREGETITNHPTVTAFSVTKEWLETEDNDWPDSLASIDFVIQRKSLATGEVDSGFTTAVTLTKALAATAAGPFPANWKGDQPVMTASKAGTRYTLTLSGLDRYAGADEWQYFVSESLLPEDAGRFTAVYYDKNRGILSEDLTFSGGYIRNVQSARSLSISKTVSGNMGDKTRAFAFTIELSGSDGTPFAGELAYTKTDADGAETTDALSFADGSAEIGIAHGETVALQDLPGGLNYAVTEEDCAGDAYLTTCALDGASPQETLTVSGTTAVDHSLAFTNSKNVLISLGVRPAALPAISAAAILLAAAALAFLYRRRKNP